MPGGTGYLERLVHTLPAIAHTVGQYLQDCPCQRSCYRCLKEFWNQRLHHLLDKRLVLTTLDMLAAAGPGVTLPPRQVQQQFESFLEQTFYEVLQARSIPLPKTQQIVRTADGAYIMRADFTYDQPPVVILTDGRAFHLTDEQTIIEDLDRRNALALNGQHLLEFTYRDVLDTPDTVIASVDAALKAVPTHRRVSERNASAALGQAWAARLYERMPQFVTGKDIQLDGATLPTLAIDQERGIALLLIDPADWMQQPATWQRDLRLHNQARIEGWTIIRVPTPWLESPEGDALLEQVPSSRLD
jgi:very-short-patch-repair endonuclease